MLLLLTIPVIFQWEKIDGAFSNLDETLNQFKSSFIILTSILIINGLIYSVYVKMALYIQLDMNLKTILQNLGDIQFLDSIALLVIILYLDKRKF